MTTTTSLIADEPPSYLAATSRCNYCSEFGNDEMLRCAECKALCHRACAGLNETLTAHTVDWKCKFCKTTTTAAASGLEVVDSAFDLGTTVVDAVPYINVARMAGALSQSTDAELPPITEAPGFNFFNPGDNTDCVLNVPVTNAVVADNDDCDFCCCDCDSNGSGVDSSDGDCGDCDCGDCDCGDCCIQ